MERTELFRNLLLMAAADGQMSEAELRLLSDRAAEWGITDDEFHVAIEDAIAGRANLTIPKDRGERREMLKEMIRMMAADGRMSLAEKKLFAVSASVLGISAEDLNQLIDETISEDDCC